MTFQFRPAVRENTPIIIGVAGASGSGKTYTALELAMGMAGTDGKIAVIDSEGRRSLHYADLRDRAGAQIFRFDHGEWRAPFSPVACLEVLKSAEAAGYRVILVDSFSDEMEGEGGLIDMAAAGTSTNGAANWAKPKAQHKLIVRWLRQTRCHVIFCLRAEERVRLEKDDKGKTVVVPIGWWPISEKRFMFDMTASFLLTPDAPGIPKPIKLQEQHRPFFPEGRPIARDSGRALAEWAAGGAPPVATQRDTYAEATEAASRGMAALQTFWNGLSRAERIEIKDSMDGLKVAASEADADADENPFRDPAITHTDPNLDDPFGGKKIEHVGEPQEDAFGLKPLSKEAEDQMREWARARAEQQNSPPAQPVHERNTGGLGGPAPGGEPDLPSRSVSKDSFHTADQSTSRPASSPGPATGHPGADASLPAESRLPVEDVSRRGGDPPARHLSTGEQRVMHEALRRSSSIVHDGERGDNQENWGRALDAVTDERLTANLPALGNRDNAANVSDRPQSDLLGDPALENLTVPLPAHPTAAELGYFGRQLLLVINEKPPTPQRMALIRQKNERGLALLKTGAVAQYDEVQAALAKPARSA